MSKALMLALPEVAYFVERVPVGRVVVKADPIQLRFFQHARDSNMPLKEQCRVLNIPWHARKIATPQVTGDALKASKAVAPTVFSMVWPSGVKEASLWTKAVLEAADGFGNAARDWIAFHVLDLGDEWDNCKSYLRTVAPAKDLAAKTLIERAKAFREEQERARAARLAQYNMIPAAALGANDFNRLFGDNPYQQADRYQREYMQQMLALQAQQAAQQQYNYALNARLGAQNIPQQPRVAVDRSPIDYDPRLLTPFESGNLVVQLLNTHEQFAEEGKRMHHCVETYFPMAKRKGCYIVSVTKKAILGDKRVATAEFNPDWEPIQAKGPANSNVGTDEHIVTALRGFAAAKKAIALPPPPNGDVRG